MYLPPLKEAPIKGSVNLANSSLGLEAIRPSAHSKQCI